MRGASLGAADDVATGPPPLRNVKHGAEQTVAPAGGQPIDVPSRIFRVGGALASSTHSMQPAAGSLAGLETETTRPHEALRAAQARYRTLVDSIDEGFCVVEVLFDDHGRPEDYRFLEVNQAFERQTGLVNATGKRMRELAPAHEAHWFQILRQGRADG